MKRNPKLEGTPLWDCVPQTGKCPCNCNQCFFNRPGAYYTPLDELPIIPDPKKVGNDIVRMNCGHDSNNQKDKVLAAAANYDKVFFNTSIPDFNFPGPVVFTANPSEEEQATYVSIDNELHNLMFVRLRVSGTNLQLIDNAIDYYTRRGVPVVLTFMAYYDQEPQVDLGELNIHGFKLEANQCYEYKVRTLNPYYCATPVFMGTVLDRYHKNRLVSICGGLYSYRCEDCRNCETYFIQTQKRLRGE